MPDPFLDAASAAAYIGAAKQTLAAARSTKTGAFSTIPYYRNGRKIAYRLSDLELWLSQNRVTNAARA